MKKTLLVAMSFMTFGYATTLFGGGLALNLPVVGRVVGGGNILYRTSLDVTNHTATTVPVDFFFTATDAVTGQVYKVEGSIGDFGVVARGAGTLSGRSNAHSDDFIADLVAANLMAAGVRDDGLTGSLLLVFNGTTKSGQGSAVARFYNDLAGGTVGVSVKAHEITTSEPKKLIAVVRDTRGKSGTQLYPNLFINNTGLTSGGTTSSASITVELTATTNFTGQPVGTTKTLTILPGQTVTVSSVLDALSVPAGTGTVLITASVTSGDGAIEGVISQVDATTRDGSLFEMSRADF